MKSGDREGVVQSTSFVGCSSLSKGWTAGLVGETLIWCSLLIKRACGSPTGSMQLHATVQGVLSRMAACTDWACHGLPAGVLTGVVHGACRANGCRRSLHLRLRSCNASFCIGLASQAMLQAMRSAVGGLCSSFRSDSAPSRGQLHQSSQLSYVEL